MATTISITLPLRTVSVLNLREHWASKHRRNKSQRRDTAMAMLQAGPGREVLQRYGGLTVVVTRIAPRPLDQHDNIGGALKAVIDGVADWLGVRDDDPRVVFKTGQERGEPKTYAVRVDVHPGDEAWAQ